MSSRATTTYSEELLELVERYRAEGEKWPATSRDLARWSLRQKLCEPREQDVIGLLARDFSRAMR